MSSQSQSQSQSTPRWKNGTFGRGNGSPSPGPPPGHARSRSTILPPTMRAGESAAHARHQSFADLGMGSLERSISKRNSVSGRAATPTAGTFAPTFIKTEELDGATDRVGGIEGENDFSGKRYVWVKDADTAFVRGWVSEELADGQLRIQCDDGSVRPTVSQHQAPDSADQNCSNVMLTAILSTRSILQNLTRPTTWQSSRI